MRPSASRRVFGRELAAEEWSGLMYMFVQRPRGKAILRLRYKPTPSATGLFCSNRRSLHHATVLRPLMLFRGVIALLFRLLNLVRGRVHGDHALAGVAVGGVTGDGLALLFL